MATRQRIQNLVQWHLFAPISSGGWGYHQVPQGYDTNTLITHTEDIVNRGGVVTWDVGLNPTGEFRVDYLVQLQTIGNRLGTTTDTTYSGLNLVNINPSSVRFHDDGEWRPGTVYNSGGLYLEDNYVSTEKDAYFEYDFVGSSIVYASTKGEYKGDVEVFIDDVSQGTYSAYTDDHRRDYNFQIIIYEKHDLSNGAHTLKVVKKSDSDKQLEADVVLSRKLDFDGTFARIGNQTNFGNGETSPAGIAISGQTLYMVGNHRNELYDLGAGNGQATRVGSANRFGLGLDNPGALAVDSGGTLYMSAGKKNSFSARLYTVNTTTGAARRVGSAEGFGASFGSPPALAFIGDTLYAADRGERALYTVNTSSGVATRVGVRRKQLWRYQSYSSLCLGPCRHQ